VYQEEVDVVRTERSEGLVERLADAVVGVVVTKKAQCRADTSRKSNAQFRGYIKLGARDSGIRNRAANVLLVRWASCEGMASTNKA
jgi:hypothetical protein